MRLRDTIGAPGVLVGSPPAHESEHFYACASCGQAVDMRQLGQVFHHEEPDHARLETDT